MKTIKDLKDYLDSFVDEEHKFTDDEIYEAGLIHKDLPRSDKDWEGLNTRLGSPYKNGENLRCSIKDRQLKEGTLPKNVKMLSGRTVDEIGLEEAQKNLEEQKQELYKQEVRTRDVRRAYHEDLRNQARTERMKDAIVDSVKGLENFTPLTFPDALNTENTEAVLLLSDLHLGTFIDNFYNHYNVEIAKKRVAKLVVDTIEECRMHKVRRLTVLNLGDMIAGLIHITARLEQEIDITEQIMIAAEIIAECLYKLQEAAPEIIYRSCTDNHSRAVADLKQNLERENFGKLIDFYLEPRLKGTKIQFINDNLDDDIGCFELLSGELMAFAHGHRDNPATAFQNFVGATKKYVSYVALAHYHNSKLKSYQGAKVFVNGSIVGSDTYAQSKRLYGPAEQTLIVFNGTNVSTTYINLDIKK